MDPRHGVTFCYLYWNDIQAGKQSFIAALIIYVHTCVDIWSFISNILCHIQCAAERAAPVFCFVLDPSRGFISHRICIISFSLFVKESKGKGG